MEDKPFRIFSRKSKPTLQTLASTLRQDSNIKATHTDRGDPETDASSTISFADLGLSKWAVDTCLELRIRQPTPVQRRCIPRILSGDDVLGIAQTGSGKTAAFALPILQRLAAEPYGVFSLVITPTRELACQLAEQFRALGSSLQLRCTLIVGGMDMIGQASALGQRPHIVVATPGRIKTLLSKDPNMPIVFSKTKNDVDLIHEIENVVGKQLDAFECKEKEVLEDITKVYKARRVARMKMIDDGFEEKAQVRKEQKIKALADKGLLKKIKRKSKE